MNALDLIERKRDSGRLSAEEINWFISSLTAQQIPDYQVSAMLMAIFLNGLDPNELATWTEAMLHSGDILEFPGVDRPLIDKHSTGGVGDKVSIALVPLVVACGVAVPMISGRGLGHTGGTLDKLEAIPGFDTQLDPDEFRRLVEENGVAMGGQTETLVPADRLLYALRDVTATVPSVPLIASSIMSKKLAESIDGLVLDVKVGKGAFMQSEASARRLAETIVGIGRSHDIPVVALLTGMDQPLGVAVGNANETAECIEVLHGRGPDDLVTLTKALACEMLMLAGVAKAASEAAAHLQNAIESGDGLEKLRQIVAAQGGDPAVVDDPTRLPQSPEYFEFVAPRDGVVTECDALLIGQAGLRLGAGRERKEDVVDPRVGLWIQAKIGDEVVEGQPLAKIGWADEGRLAQARSLLDGAWVISDGPALPPPLVIGEVR